MVALAADWGNSGADGSLSVFNGGISIQSGSSLATLMILCRVCSVSSGKNPIQMKKEAPCGNILRYGKRNPWMDVDKYANESRKPQMGALLRVGRKVNSEFRQIIDLLRSRVSRRTPVAYTEWPPLV